MPYSTYLYLDFHLLFRDKAKRTQQGNLLHFHGQDGVKDKSEFGLYEHQSADYDDAHSFTNVNNAVSENIIP